MIPVPDVFWNVLWSVALLGVIGIYCILFTYNLIRALIGLEILTKAATLIIIVCGYVNGHLAQAQSMAITLIVVEVVVISIAGGIILSLYRHHGTIDSRKLRQLRG